MVRGISVAALVSMSNFVCHGKVFLKIMTISKENAFRSTACKQKLRCQPKSYGLEFPIIIGK